MSPAASRSHPYPANRCQVLAPPPFDVKVLFHLGETTILLLLQKSKQPILPASNI